MELYLWKKRESNHLQWVGFGEANSFHLFCKPGAEHAFKPRHNIVRRVLILSCTSQAVLYGKTLHKGSKVFVLKFPLVVKTLYSKFVQTTFLSKRIGTFVSEEGALPHAHV